MKSQVLIVLMSRMMLMSVALGILVGCDGPTEHRYRDIHIAFEYQGHRYNETWINDCVAHSDNEAWVEFFRAHLYRSIRSRWDGFAKRLPDGSGVLFKFRHDICGNSEVAQYLYGHPVQGDNYRYYDIDRQKTIEASAAAAPADFFMPNVYCSTARHTQRV